MRASVAEDTIGGVCDVDGAPSRNSETMPCIMTGVTLGRMYAGLVGGVKASVNDAALVTEVAVASDAMHTGGVGGVALDRGAPAGTSGGNAPAL